MRSNYDKIREENIIEYGKGTRHLAFLGKLYSDRTHFIFELLQNAEDEDATRIQFALFRDRLEVRHDGTPFDEEDVKGICGVAIESKEGDLTQIGKFGIGFKSVYAYTLSPEIHSGDEHFRIEFYVRPYAAKIVDPGKDSTTLFIFPFNAEKVKAETCYEEIKDRLSSLSARPLLFLRNIKEISYTLVDGTGGHYKREGKSKTSGGEMKISGGPNGKIKEEDWLIFGKEVPCPEMENKENSRNNHKNKKPIWVEIGFQKIYDEKWKEKRIEKITESPLIVFFPTKMETRLGFLVQGPYRTTPSREYIPPNDDWNKKLVLLTTELLAEALLQMKKTNILSVNVLKTLPIRLEDFPSDGMFYPFVTKIQQTLQEQELLPTYDETYVSAKYAKLAHSEGLRELLTPKQLQELWESPHELHWLSSDITRVRTPDLFLFLMDGLKVEEIDNPDVGRQISESFLEKQSDEWMVDFYAFLGSNDVLWKQPTKKGEGVLRKKRFIRLEKNNQLARPFNEQEEAIIYLPPPENTDFPIVKRSIAKQKEALAFFIALGLIEPNIFDDIIQRVLLKYSPMNVDRISDQEHENDIQKILRAMQSDSEKGKKRLLEALKETPFIRAKNPQTVVVAYKKPTELYQDIPELRKYFLYYPEAWFSAESSKNDWQSFEIASLPRRILTQHIPPDCPVKRRSILSVENYDLDGLQNFLYQLYTITEFQEKKARALILWNFLDQLLKKDYCFFLGILNYQHYNQKRTSFTSSFLNLLHEKEWIPTKSGKLSKPVDIALDQMWEEFSQENSELIKILGIQPDSRETIEQQNASKMIFAKELGVEMADIEFMKQNKQEFQKWKEKLTSQINKKPEFPIRNLQNTSRREEKFLEDLGYAVKKTFEEKERSIRTSKGAIDAQSWLRSQYTNTNGEMVCQICKEVMPFKKRDGKYYFEAVEALSDIDLETEHQFLALCPICAAMYKEFIKSDKNAMNGVKEGILKSMVPRIEIKLGNITTTIEFVETHFLDFQTLLKKVQS